MEKKKKSIQAKDMEISTDITTLPHNQEVERGTIGAMLLEKSAVSEVMDILKPGMFYNEFLNQVYDAIITVEAHSEVDIITVSEELRKKSIKFDINELVSLSDEITSAAHVQIHARIVYQDYLRRKFIMNCAKSITESNDMSLDVVDLISNHVFEIENLSNVSDTIQTVSINKIALEAFNEYKEREERSRQGISMGVHTGLGKLDNVLHGFQPGAVYILASRPGMGKTAFLLNIARRAAKRRYSVVIFSLEMTKRSLIDRMVIAESGVNSEDFKTGRLSPEEFGIMAESLESLSTLPISINDKASITIQQIRAQAKKLKKQGKCDIVMIDYLQLIDIQTLNGKTKNDEVSVCSRAVKIMAKDLNVPVVLLSQLNRGVEERSDKIPRLSDLRDSGAIEQDADGVLLIYRESYYDTNKNHNDAVIRVAKNREGKTGDIHIWVNDSITDFRDEDPAIGRKQPVKQFQKENKEVLPF